MYNLKVENHRGDILTLTNNPNYKIYRVEGLNPPQASINSSVNTTQDGSKVNSARVESRNIVIYVSIEGDIEANRINLYKYFPVKKSITLYFSNGTRDVSICGNVEIIECDLFANKQVAQISIICPNPYFKGIDELVTIFSDIMPMFEFPFSISAEGVEFSSITPNIRKSIVNAGDTESGVIIELFATGTVVNPIIYDVFKGTYIALNLTMQPLDTIIINTNVGEKSITLVRAGVSSNAMGYMRKDSKWFIFEAGDNVYTYDCDSGNDNLQIKFTTPLLYSGV